MKLQNDAFNSCNDISEFKKKVKQMFRVHALEIFPCSWHFHGSACCIADYSSCSHVQSDYQDLMKHTTNVK
jgi:hypothetical protein